MNSFAVYIPPNTSKIHNTRQSSFYYFTFG